jgi:hypothetical protein
MRMHGLLFVVWCLILHCSFAALLIAVGYTIFISMINTSDRYFGSFFASLCSWFFLSSGIHDWFLYVSEIRYYIGLLVFRNQKNLMENQILLDSFLSWLVTGYEWHNVQCADENCKTAFSKNFCSLQNRNMPNNSPNSRQDCVWGGTYKISILRS